MDFDKLINCNCNSCKQSNLSMSPDQSRDSIKPHKILITLSPKTQKLGYDYERYKFTVGDEQRLVEHPRVCIYFKSIKDMIKYINSLHFIEIDGLEIIIDE